MEADVLAAFKTQGETLATIGGNVEEIKESIHGQAMAIRDVDHRRELCRANMNREMGDVAKAAKKADDKAERAHKRITWLAKAAWALVFLALAELLALGVWAIKAALLAKGGG